MTTFREMRWSFYAGSLLWISGAVQAEEPNPSPTPLRMWHVGNSVSAALPFEAVDLQRVFYHHSHSFGHDNPEYNVTKGWIGQALEKDRAQKNLLEKGDFDLVYVGFIQLGRPVPGMDLFFDIVQQHKPGATIYLQHQWAMGGGKGAHDEDDLDKLDAAWATNRAAVEAAVDQANERAGKPVVFVIPLHDAVMKLRRMVKDGTFPRVTKQEDLFHTGADGRRDEHGLDHIYALAAFCAHAAIHRTSPAGLRTDFSTRRLANHSKLQLDDEQIAVLQRIAWETVSKYRYAGVDPTP